MNLLFILRGHGLVSVDISILSTCSSSHIILRNHLLVILVLILNRDLLLSILNWLRIGWWLILSEEATKVYLSMWVLSLLFSRVAWLLTIRSCRLIGLLLVILRILIACTWVGIIILCILVLNLLRLLIRLETWCNGLLILHLTKLILILLLASSWGWALIGYHSYLIVHQCRCIVCARSWRRPQLFFYLHQITIWTSCRIISKVSYRVVRIVV